jgi:hypothetical protein
MSCTSPYQSYLYAQEYQMHANLIYFIIIARNTERRQVTSPEMPIVAVTLKFYLTPKLYKFSTEFFVVEARFHFVHTSS